MKYIIAALLLFSLKPAYTQYADKEIRLLMNRQQTAWNQGNLTAFMEGYLKSDSLLFVGSKGPTYGWNTTLDHYRKSYPDTAAMGKLKFDILEIRELSNEYYFVLGKWHLKRTIGDASGFYTLLFKKINNRYYIIADHSS